MTGVNERQLISRLKTISMGTAVSAVLLGVSVLYGYVIRSQALKSALHGIVAMNPMTAVAFILGGISLAIFLREKRTATLSRIGFACAATMALIGLVKLGGIVSGHDVVFDRLLFSGQLDDAATGYQNRIAPNTAMNFLLIGIALLLLYRGMRTGAAHVLAVIAFIIGLLAVIGYVFGVNNLIGFARYIPMALNTALGFLAISIGILFASPRSGLMATVTAEDAGGAIACRLLPAAIAVPAFLGYVLNSGSEGGLYTSQLSLSLIVVANIVVGACGIWLLAVRLHTIDVERKIAQDELEAHKIKDETLLSSIGDGVVAIDSAWTIIRWNAAAARITGWTEQEAIGAVPRHREVHTRTRPVGERTFHLRGDGLETGPLHGQRHVADS